MLKNIDSLLNADLLSVLREMGHGDVIIIADANFPSYSVAKETVIGHPLRVDAKAPTVIRAILSVFPLDQFDDNSVKCMEAPGETPVVQLDTLAVVTKFGVQESTEIFEERIVTEMENVERFAFYELAKKAYAVVQTTENRGYGCFALAKGVIVASL